MVNDDTRDIALDARASSASAHRRLDMINGQIARGAEATEKLREDTTAGFAKLTEDVATGHLLLVQGQATTNNEVAAIKSTLKIATWIVGVATTVASGIAVGLAVYTLKQGMPVKSSPPPTGQPAASLAVPK